MRQEENRVCYTAQDIYIKNQKKTYGWVYGINRMIQSGKKKMLRQYAADFFGAKEKVKEVCESL